MALRRGRSFQGRAKRAGTNWGRLDLTQSHAVAASTKLLLGSFVLDNPGIAETVRRTRGVIIAHSDQGSVFERSAVAFGMIVVTDAALAIGVTAIPGPFSDGSDDGWFVYEVIAFTDATLIGASVSTLPGVPAATGRQFDSKAMRKVESGFSIAIMAETSNQGANMGMQISLLSSRG